MHNVCIPSSQSHYDATQVIYAEPNIRPKLGNAPTKSSKDSGYYSCEFLDQNSYSSPSVRVANHRDSSCDKIINSKHRSLSRHQLPPSDSGVFTLSRVCNRPSQYSLTSHQDGIYDNVI